MEQAFRRARHRRELETWAQPIVRTDGRGIVGVELFTRWRRPGHGIVGPDMFVPLAEEAGSTIELGRWALDRAADVLEEWSDHPLLHCCSVSVNISGRHLISGNLAADVDRAVVSPARAFGQTVVAEGTETSEQAAAVTRLGADFAQGSPLRPARTGAGPRPPARHGALPHGVGPTPLTRSAPCQ